MSIAVIGICIYSIVSTIGIIWLDAQRKKEAELFELYPKMSDEIIERLQRGEES